MTWGQEEVVTCPARKVAAACVSGSRTLSMRPFQLSTANTSGDEKSLPDIVRNLEKRTKKRKEGRVEEEGQPYVKEDGSKAEELEMERIKSEELQEIGSDESSTEEAEHDKEDAELIIAESTMRGPRMDVYTNKSERLRFWRVFLMPIISRVPKESAFGEIEKLREKWTQQAVDASASAVSSSALATVEQFTQALINHMEAPRIAIILLKGGHFAAAIYNEQQKLICHKTFHKYIVRKKAGGRQSGRDGMSSGSAPRSVGASLRRQNEAALERDVTELLESWKPELEKCTNIFYHAPSINAKVLFPSDGHILSKADARVASIPLNVGRPTLSEVDVTLKELTSVEISHYSLEPSVTPELQGDEREQATAAGTSLHRGETGEEKQAEEESISEEEQKKQMFQTAVADLDTKAVLRGLDIEPEVGIDDLLPDASRPSYIDAVLLGTEKDKKKEWTALHAVAKASRKALIRILLLAGADPTVRDALGRTPYDVAEEKGARDEFRYVQVSKTPTSANAYLSRFMARYPEAWDYSAARIPSALTPEMEVERLRKEEEKKDKLKEKKREAKKRQKQKAKERKDNERAEQAAANELARMVIDRAEKERNLTPEERRRIEREKRAAAAEARLGLKAASGQSVLTCAFCGKALEGMVPFERLTFKYCSVACVQHHKREMEANK